MNNNVKLMEETNSAFVLIKRKEGTKFSVATVDYIKDIETCDLSLLSSAPTSTVACFLREKVGAEAGDLEAMIVYGADNTEIACLWFNKNRDPNPDSVSAVLSSVNSGAAYYLRGNVVITGPGYGDGNLDFLDPSRASIIADGLNASQIMYLCPNSTMQIGELPFKQGSLAARRKPGFN